MVVRWMTMDEEGKAYQDNALPPSTSPLATNKRNPIPLSPKGLSYRNARVHLDAHAEIQLEGWRRKLQRSSNLALREGMKQVVGGNRIFHDGEVGRALQQVLTLPAGVFGADLLAVDALHGQTLWLPSQIMIPRHSIIPIW